jgi:hypothetical protein
MRREYALAGFVMTGDEWDALDEPARRQLLAALLRNDGAWHLPAGGPLPPGAAPDPQDAVPEPIDGPEPYAHYELVLSAA